MMKNPLYRKLVSEMLSCYRKLVSNLKLFINTLKLESSAGHSRLPLAVLYVSLRLDDKHYGPNGLESEILQQMHLTCHAL